MTGVKIAGLPVASIAATIATIIMIGAMIGTPRSATAQATSASAPSAVVSYEFFKTRVQPIFLKQRGEHARCYGCHILSNRIFHLETLSPGSTDWTDEQSHKNFQSAQEVVNSEDPIASKLLLHPLAPEAGGDPFHSGGRQFASQNDPDWLAMAEWVRGLRTEPASSSLPLSQPLI